MKNFLRQYIGKIVKEEISNVLNKTSYYDNIDWDDEICEFDLFEPYQTNLLTDIYLDTCHAYKRNKHPLWVYFKNGRTVLPILISKQPKILFKHFKFNVSYETLKNVFNFIIKYKNMLIKLANEEITRDIFEKFLKNNQKNNRK